MKLLKMSDISKYVYNDVDNTIDGLESRLEKQFNIVNSKIKNNTDDILKVRFSIDALIKSVSNYIRDQRNFDNWYSLQPIWKIIWWKIKKYDITYIKDNFYLIKDGRENI